MVCELQPLSVLAYQCLSLILEMQRDVLDLSGAAVLWFFLLLLLLSVMVVVVGVVGVGLGAAAAAAEVVSLLCFEYLFC